MPYESHHALILRTSDWSESSRIATLWTRDAGKMRALAKGGRRLKSSFDNALDLLTVCDIVLLRKPSGTSLDLLTEARVTRRFPRLQHDLSALYAGYYVAELLADLTQDHDPHPPLFYEALSTLDDLGGEGVPVGLRVMRFEAVFLAETGFRLMLTHCAGCQDPVGRGRLVLSPQAGGVLCDRCASTHRDHAPLSHEALDLLLNLEDHASWRRPWPDGVRREVRRHLGVYVTTIRGKPLRLLPYLGS